MYFSLRYNRTTHTSQNAEGVDIRIDSFGDTTTVEWLDPNPYVHSFSDREYLVFRDCKYLVLATYGCIVSLGIGFDAVFHPCE